MLQIDFIIPKIISLFKNGFFHIFGSTIINKGINFITVSLIARLLDKDDYGIFIYSYNILDFFILFQGLGLVNSVLQFCSESQDDKGKLKYLNYALKFGNIFNLFLIILSVVFSLFFPFKEAEASVIFRILLPLLIFTYLVDCLSAYLRALKLNKQYAYSTNVNTISLMLGTVVGSAVWGLYGYILGLYFARFITLFIIVFFLKKDIYNILKNNLKDKEKKKTVIKYSVTSMLSNVVSQSLYLIDTFIIGIVCTGTAVIAEYKIATQIPFSLYFISSSLMTFIYPYFAENRNNYEWLSQKIRQVFLFNFLTNVSIGVLLFVLADKVILFVYGDKYVNIITIFRILVLSYILGSCIRIPTGNILAMLRFVKFNLYNSVFTGIANVILDIWLINDYGAIGAAYATLLSIFISCLWGAGALLVALSKIKNK